MTHDAFIKHVAFSPDSRWEATASDDGTARVWEVPTEHPTERALPDDPEELISEACTRVGRNFTEAEWQQYFSDEPYGPTCPNLPVPGQP